MKIHKKIGIFYPAAYPDKDKMEAGIKNAGKQFDAVETYQPLENAYRYLARNPEKTLDEFRFFLERKDIDFLISARGGAGVLFLVNQLIDRKVRIPQQISVPVGFSDLTALFCYLWEKHKLPSIYGPVIAYHYANYDQWKTAAQFESLITGKNELVLSNYGDLKLIYQPGENAVTSGIIMPVCLSIFAECVNFTGTGEKLILIMEDINEKAYKIERYMNLLAYKGILDRTAAIVLGDFLNIDKPEWLKEIMTEAAQKFSIPLLSGLNFGHHLHSVSLPFGVTGELDMSLLQMRWESFLRK